ncbi:Domain of uncharacterised function (DUF477) [Kytococcus sedentarius]|uniref:TPM domain-containing protein n=1 Tax=Kytococcus sedentarius (strain ATCC 14392 / DSM 20547 / JCM 11482 / CCUG 33030 / NBRC 15357 / NCTC 11040 / CCM 314 / 541) TaxID=478801 RepID=C7NET7_KYTSD|nr:protein of unknown function (DUF477) [Kytococcus sedentarius DSM 20547]STX12825.1 Domain of uncharacterised function (DUF477) [Kytococcus sedentarius]
MAPRLRLLTAFAPLRPARTSGGAAAVLAGALLLPPSGALAADAPRVLSSPAGPVAAHVVAGPTPLALPATEPMDLPEQIVDEAGVLDDKASLRNELATLRDDHGMQLFVVYVDEFTDGSGAAMSGEDWAEQTFSDSGLGTKDALLAVAVDQRRYGMWGGQETVSAEEGARIETDYVEPALSREDWSGAVSAAVQGFDDVAEGTTGGGADSRGGDGFGFPVWLLGVPFLIGGFFLLRNLGSPKRRGQRHGAAQSGARADSPEQLERRAAELLVQVDDAVRSSDEEVRYSRAQFGEQATQEFTHAVQVARGKASEAFALKQRVDDALRQGTPEESLRGELEQITVLAGEALATLEAQGEKFERLRDLEARAPEVLRQITRRADELEARLPGAREQLRALQVSYSPGSLTTVGGNIEQAERLIASARQSSANGQKALGTDDRRTAVTAARTGEDALGQAADLLDAVDGARQTLENSQHELARAIGSISQDIADAERLRPDDGALAPLVQRAQQAIAHAESSRSGGDPLAALAELEAAEDAIDAALEPARTAEENRRKISGTVGQRLARLRAAHASVDEFIRTRRGSVGSRARTEISEAGRLLDAAEHRLQSDPRAAMELLDQAERLIESARRDAEDDLQQGPFGGGGYGGYGPRGGNYGGIDIGSLVLGGILSGGFGGGGFGGGGGGFGGGGGGFGGGGGGFGGIGGSGGGGFGGGGRF